MAEENAEKRAAANSSQDTQALVAAGLIAGGIGAAAVIGLSKTKAGGVLGSAGKRFGQWSGRNLAAIPTNFVRGVFSDTRARQNPAAHIVLSDSDHQAWYDRSRSAWSGYGQKVADHKNASKAYYEATEKFGKEATAEFAHRGDPIVENRTPKSFGMPLLETQSGMNVTATGENLEQIAALRREAITTHRTLNLAQAGRKATFTNMPISELVKPTNLMRGFRGAMSKAPSFYQPARLLAHNAGRSVTYIAKHAPRVALGIVNDLAKGRGSTIVKAATVAMIAKSLAPLPSAAYHATLGSEERYNGNPMLSGLANANSDVPMTRAQEEAHYDAMSPASAARQRFETSSQGLGLSLAKLRGRI